MVMSPAEKYEREAMDRMGVVKSESFDFLQEPHYLLLYVAAVKFATPRRLVTDPDSNCLATSVLFTWSINEAKPGTSVLISNVFLRSKYFYMSTLALNLLCTGEVMVLKGFHALF